MGPGQFWTGWWIIFPLIMCGAMMFFMMSRRGDSKPRGRRNAGVQPGEGAGTETARDILSKRYAKGEITREEFEEMKKAV
jgi:putative membrane protein